MTNIESQLNIVRNYASDTEANVIDFHRAIDGAFILGATAWQLMDAARMTLDEVTTVLASHPDTLVV